jgi:hypothetical protein
VRVSPLRAVGITRYHRPTDAFEPIRRSFLRNPEITLRAFRVGAYVLSHAEGFVQTQAQIARGTGLAVTTVRAALEDLRADRFLVSRRIREAGRWVGTAYAVSDVPFTDEELAALSAPCADSVCSDSEHRESDGRKETTPVRETIASKKTKPSGGSAPLEPPAPEATMEEAMATATDPGQFGLFEPEPQVLQSQARQGGKTAAQLIVAAYVDSYRRNHSGGDPVKRDIGRVARDVKAALGGGTSVDELTRAATEMGTGPFANLGVSLNKVREGGRRGGVRSKGIAPPAAQDDPAWDGWEEDNARQAAEACEEYPEIAAWMAGGPMPDFGFPQAGAVA